VGMGSDLIDSVALREGRKTDVVQTIRSVLKQGKQRRRNWRRPCFSHQLSSFLAAGINKARRLG